MISRFEELMRDSKLIYHNIKYSLEVPLPAITKRKLREWLKEFKRGFPKLTDRLVQGKQYTTEQMLLMCESWHREVQEYLKRWLGD